MRPGERAEATATRGGHGTALKPRVHAEVAATIAAATMVAAVEAIRAFALPRRSPAKRLPDDVLRYVASFVGSLPDVDEAVRLRLESAAVRAPPSSQRPTPPPTPPR